MDTPNKSNLIKEIHKSFEGVCQPEKLTLHVAEAHDGYDYDHKKHSHLDPRGRWQDVPTEHIEKCQMALCYVDKVGMRYYLPAYMVWYINKMDSGEIESDHTLYSLNNYSGDERMSSYFQERFSLFTLKQLKACANFVKYCSDDKEDICDSEFAKEIYDNYWVQFS